MGCQKDIVEQIVDGGGDCVIAAKDNQPTLKTAIETFFNGQIERDFEDLRLSPTRNDRRCRWPH